MLNLINHMTDSEKAEISEMLNASDVDMDVIAELVSEVDFNELAHWSICKRQGCHKLKVKEPPFTRDEFLAICNAGKEEDKRRVFADILTQKIKEIKMNAVINAKDLPNAHGIMDKLDAGDRLVSLLIQREEIVAKKKAAVRECNDIIKSLDRQIVDEANDYKSGQRRLFDGDEGESIQ